MKLELKHITPYLPYRLQCYGASCIWTIHSMSSEYISFFNGVHLQENSFDDFVTDYSILLRPLSDLTKEIEVNGERFVPIVELLKILYKDKLYPEKDSHYNDIEYCTEGYARAWFKIRAQLNIMVLNYEIEKQPYWLLQKLLEWHFDCFNLLENDLAIDINTLNQNI